jgi:hypothetical protein
MRVARSRQGVRAGCNARREQVTRAGEACGRCSVSRRGRHPLRPVCGGVPHRGAVDTRDRYGFRCVKCHGCFVGRGCLSAKVVQRHAIRWLCRQCARCSRWTRCREMCSSKSCGLVFRIL